MVKTDAFSPEVRQLMPGWLERNRLALPEKEDGRSVSQEEIAKEISTAEGWHLDRSTYSKYESGGSPIGPKVAAHFLSYWDSRGVAGPELSPATAEAPVDPIVAAIDRQTKALTALVAEILKLRTEDRDRIVGLDRTVTGLLDGSLLPGSGAGALPVPPVPQEKAE